jgi:transposase-like protein
MPNVQESTRATTGDKVELVLRALAGETLADLAHEAGRPRKQLSVWQRRFLAGGEAALDGRGGDERQLAALREERDALAAKVARLEADNRTLARRLALRERTRGRAPAHPNCSEAYARAFDEPGVRPLRVAAWGTHVLVRDGRKGALQATGVRPYAALDPECDVAAGLDELRAAGVVAVSLITDPLWCPEPDVLDAAFTVCRPFKTSYYVDRESAPVHIAKRHRNMVNRARRAGEVRELALADHLDRWLELYAGNVAERRIPQPFGASYFQHLAREVDGVRTVAVVVDDELAAMTLWVRHDDILYFYDGASSATGFATSAAYAAFAHVVETATDCRYVFLGGSADFHDDPTDGLAKFKRGFSNASTLSHLCSATLSTAARPR